MKSRSAASSEASSASQTSATGVSSTSATRARQAQNQYGNEWLAASLPTPDVDPAETSWQAEVDRFEAEYQEMVETARALGYHVAADNLDHFLAGRGGIRTLPVAWLRSFDATLKAERENQQRFETSLAEIAQSLAEGETRTFTDHWDRQFTANPATELYYASGTSTLTSTGMFSLRKADGVVTIEGLVSHRWWDPYDWHPGATAFVPGFGFAEDRNARELCFERGAQEFDMESKWTQTLSARVEIVEWWPDTQSFEWKGP